MPHPSKLIGHQTIYHDPAYYSAWPALIRAANGDLLLSFCRTQEHLSPSGTVVTMRSQDNGHTWSEPVVVYDSIIDDRENGLTVLPDGRIVLHIWSQFWKSDHYTRLYPGSYADDLLTDWKQQVDGSEYLAAEKLHGSWTLISSDHGHTWSAPIPGPDSVHGGVALQNGSLIIASYRHSVRFCEIYGTPDPTTPWRKLAEIHCPLSDTHYFGEPHITQLPSGRVLAAFRCTAIAYDDTRDDLNVWIAWSDDNGVTWSAPHRTALLGFPPHLLVLADGRTVCTYGYRRTPYGERACVSNDGITWDPANEIILRDDNEGYDLGYPASVETEPGEVLSVYYQKPRLDPTDKHKYKVGIYATRWRVGDT
jgi:sialidase-1